MQYMGRADIKEAHQVTITAKEAITNLIRFDAKYKKQ